MKTIDIDEQKLIFTLTARFSQYQMRVSPEGVLRHVYYGEAAGGADLTYLERHADRGFSGDYYESSRQKGNSPDLIPQEYGSFNAGDYRICAARAVHENGSRTTDFRFRGWKVYEGRKALTGLPYARCGADEDVMTLEIDLRDEAADLEAVLYYHVFPQEDVIVRSARITNTGSSPVILEKAASMGIDFPSGCYDLIHFEGRHLMERVPRRMQVPEGVFSVGSVRGASSHQHNPFLVLCEREATERAGGCWGFMLTYSGNFCIETEKSQTGSVRVCAGIHKDLFSWQLQSGASFQTPECMLSYSARGLGGLSLNYHRMLREHILPERHRADSGQVLLNTWEAAYFDFSKEKLLEQAGAAKNLGIDLFVLDDGWFGARNNDKAGLGDWQENRVKLGGTLGQLAEEICSLGLRFGLWIEPEMVNEDSQLYRDHPDWALADPGRLPVVGRNQLVLDMSRPEVVDYLYGQISALLENARISYIKWDMNRSLSNVYSLAQESIRQGETSHRFMLGTYDLLNRLTRRFPDVMIEGCAGGGGRFDAGMLFYCPQIWCSDDTDPVARIAIQRGTSFGYPVSTMGSHVSASPNHQTGRTTPMSLRFAVAMSGTFGYELDLTRITPRDREDIRAQIAFFKTFADLIGNGDYYRLGESGRESGEEKGYHAWQFVSPDRGKALVTLADTGLCPNPPFPHVRMMGLDPDAVYRVEEICGNDIGRYAERAETAAKADAVKTGSVQNEPHLYELHLSGIALMKAGYTFSLLSGEDPVRWLILTREQE